MPPLENARHERFAQELAKGKTADEAYTNAGYIQNRKNASRLKTNEDIGARLAELQARAAVRTEITATAITDRLLKIADVAERTGIVRDKETGEATASSSKHLMAARACLMDAAKLNGLVIDQSEIKATVSQLSPAERRSRLAELEAKHRDRSGGG